MTNQLHLNKRVQLLLLKAPADGMMEDIIVYTTQLHQAPS
jgi:hypothetical protein